MRSGADADDEAPIGEAVEGGDGFGRRDGPRTTGSSTVVASHISPEHVAWLRARWGVEPCTSEEQVVVGAQEAVAEVGRALGARTQARQRGQSAANVDQRQVNAVAYARRRLTCRGAESEPRLWPLDTANV